jgi:hypothetical protein
MTAFECQENNRGHRPVDKVTDQQGKRLGGSLMRPSKRQPMTAVSESVSRLFPGVAVDLPAPHLCRREQCVGRHFQVSLCGGLFFISVQKMNREKSLDNIDLVAR